MKLSFKNLFYLNEFRESPILPLFALYFFITSVASFMGWIYGDPSTLFCSPHISQCDWWKQLLLFHGFPESYARSAFYSLLLGVVFSGITALYYKKYTIVWLSVFLLWLYKTLYVGVFSSGNYDYYDIILGSVFLFSANKLFYLRICFVFLYFIASTIKFHEGWILGTYFTSLQTGIPIFPDSTTVIWTHIVIVAQIVLCWGLLAHKKTYFFIFSEVFFIFFHFYSGLLVEFRYLITNLPAMLLLFLFPREIPYKKTNNFFIHTLFVVLLAMQSIGIVIPGDQKLTLEGNEYGLYMFEANHQCVAKYSLYSHSGNLLQEVYRSNKMARERCNPYDAVNRFKLYCKNAGVAKIALTFDHSINGSAFYRIVDEPNLCQLKYHPFSHNTWIKTEYDAPKLIGYPVKNFYSGYASIENKPILKDSLIILPGQENNDRISWNALQKILAPFSDYIIIAYWNLWVIVGFGALVAYIRYLKQNR